MTIQPKGRQEFTEPKEALKIISDWNKKEPNTIYIIALVNGKFVCGNIADFHLDMRIDIMAIMWKNSCISSI